MYEIVKYVGAHKGQVLGLLPHLLGQNHQENAAYFEWKHERNPYIGSPHIYLALHDGAVIGMRAWFGGRWEFGTPSQSVPILCGGDFVIDPGHRGKGAARQIMDAALADIAGTEHRYVASLSASPVTALSSLATGWRSVGSLQPVRRETVASSATIPHVTTGRSSRPGAMARLVTRVQHDGRLRHVRDQEYFAWRFQNPRAAYRFLFWEDTQLEGYLVVQTAGGTQGKIVDLEAINRHVMEDLLEAACRCGNAGDLTVWSATLSYATKWALRAAGFKPLGDGALPRCDAVLVRSTRDDMLDGEWALGACKVDDIGSWDLRMIYSDGN